MLKIHGEEVSVKKLARRAMRRAMDNVFIWRETWEDLSKQLTDVERAGVSREIDELYERICDKFCLPNNMWD